jgi:thiol-disulfide isomerase/thioredoxin
MSGNDKADSTARQAQGGGNWALYSLVALFAAIAGFLAVSLADLASRYQAVNQAIRPTVGTMEKTAAPAKEGKRASGLEKLVRAAEPKPMPAITFADGEGREIALADMKGKVLLVNLWATWCAPCKVEMPSLNRLSAKLGGPDFAVVPISFDWSGPDKPRAFLAEAKLDALPLHMDIKKDLMQKFGAPGLPLSVLIDREGREVARLAGTAEWDSAEAEALIRKVMSK